MISQLVEQLKVDFQSSYSSENYQQYLTPDANFPFLQVSFSYNWCGRSLQHRLSTLVAAVYSSFYETVAPWKKRQEGSIRSGNSHRPVILAVCPRYLIFVLFLRLDNLSYRYPILVDFSFIPTIRFRSNPYLFPFLLLSLSLFSSLWDLGPIEVITNPYNYISMNYRSHGFYIQLIISIMSGYAWCPSEVNLPNFQVVLPALFIAAAMAINVAVPMNSNYQPRVLSFSMFQSPNYIPFQMRTPDTNVSTCTCIYNIVRAVYRLIFNMQDRCFGRINRMILHCWLSGKIKFLVAVNLINLMLGVERTLAKYQ